MIVSNKPKSSVLKSPKDRVFSDIYSIVSTANQGFIVYLRNANVTLGGIWGNQGGWFDYRNGEQPVIDGEEIQIKILKSQYKEINTILITYRDYTVDLLPFPKDLKLTKLICNNGAIFQNSAELGTNPSFKTLTSLELQGSPPENPTEFLLALESLTDLVILRVYACDLSGFFNPIGLTNIRELNIFRNKFNQEQLDFFVQKLYEGGASFTGTGKRLIMHLQPGLIKASGSFSDSPADGSGQGFINGLVDEYGWTVTQ